MFWFYTDQQTFHWLGFLNTHLHILSDGWVYWKDETEHNDKCNLEKIYCFLKVKSVYSFDYLDELFNIFTFLYTH